VYFQNDEYITNIKTSVRECLERLEFKTNQGRSFYFGSRTSVEHSARLAIADKGQVIAFAGDLSTSFQRRVLPQQRKMDPGMKGETMRTMMKRNALSAIT
jgi:hypothetical protein